MFIYFERESVCERAGEGQTERERERERERLRERFPIRLHAVNTKPDAGLKLTNHEIMT